MGILNPKTGTQPSVAHFPSSTETWTNEKIIVGVAKRDPLAGQALYEKYHIRVGARVQRLLGPDSECEDQVQQIFQTLISTISTVRDPALLDRWVDRIIVNTVRKELRKRRRRWFVSYSPEPLEASDTSNQETTLLFKRAAAVLDALHPDERIAFVLRFVVDEEVARIADMCHWSMSTTKRRIAKARDNFLKKAMRDPMLQSFREGLSNGDE